MKKLNVIALLAVLSASAAAQTRPPLEFRGLRPGMSIEEVHAVYLTRIRQAIADEGNRMGWSTNWQHLGDWNCNATAAAVFCDYHTSVRSPLQAGFNAAFVDDKLALATFAAPTGSYQAMLAALVNKFGKADRLRVAEYQNRMGATFKGVISTWRSGTVTITLQQRYTSPDEFAVTVADDELSALYQKRAHPVPDI